MTDSTNTSNSSAGSSSTSAKSMTPAERKKYIEELKKKKETEAKEKKRREREEKRKNSEGKSNSKIIIVVSLLVLVGIAIVLYFVNSEMFTGKQQLDATEKEIEEKVARLTQDIDSIVKDLPVEDADQGIPVEKQEPKVANSFTLNTPCWIISHSSMVSEKYAKRNVEIFSDKGIKCGYYWIPDYNPSGNKFYKVYFGPYASKSEAKKALPEMKRYSPQAYLLYLK